MKVLLTGATGFVGSRLRERLELAGHEVLPVSRRPGRGYDWSEGSLREGVAAADAVVHLAGENLFGKRWTAEQKERIRASRVDTTERLARLVAERRPTCFVSASAVGYYGPSDVPGLDEHAPPGDDFLAGVCRDWEAAAEAAIESGVRTARVRIGVVLGPDGGALAQLLPIFRLGVGGPVGSGRQGFSWVHREDLCSLFLFLLENERAQGAFNATAPEPVTMKDFARTLGRVLHRPAVLPVPGFALKLALGEVADVLLTGQHVLPRRAREIGFEFRFPELEGALRDVLDRPAPSGSRRAS